MMAKLDFLCNGISEITSFEQRKEQAEMIIQYLIDNKLVPGASVTVTKQGKILWQAGYGYADIENKVQVDPCTTLFRIGSVSKPISAVALAKMYESKQIDWNESLYRYVSDFPIKTFDFTIKQLGGHIAGIRGYKGKEMFSNKPISIEEGVLFFANDSLEFPPGTRYSYNSFNWNLISLAMQKEVCLPFEEVVLHNVLIPLQMTNTLPDFGWKYSNQAVAYSRSGKKFSFSPSVNNYYKLASGGYLSTSEDISLLGEAMLKGFFLNSEVQTEMLSSQKIGEEQSATGYGIGWQVGKDWNNRPYYGHVGNAIGGYAWFYCYPQEQLVIVLLFNVGNPKIEPFLRCIVDLTVKGSSQYSSEIKQLKDKVNEK